MSKPHTQLLAWQKSMDLVVEIYQFTKTMPKEETYGLTSQLRRASVAVPSNISEGAANRSKAEFRNYLSIAIGSLNEIQTQLMICFRVGYINQHDFARLEKITDECIALTYGLRRSL